MITKVNSPTTDAIQRRFFLAIESLLDTKKMKSLSFFCERHDLHRPKYANLKRHYISGAPVDYKIIDVDALAFLCTDYGVSSDWLLFGTGNMFK